MLSKHLKDKIAQATVTITQLGGRGVLVDGNILLTAAHCVNYSIEGKIVLGDHFIEEIETRQGRKLKVGPIAVEPVCDIAALGALDEQTFFNEYNSFGEFCEITKPVQLSLDEFDLGREYPVNIYTHKDTWVVGSASRMPGNAPTIWVETEEKIERGTSGSPIVNNSGELVGIVSNVPDGNLQKYDWRAPFPQVALPVWILRMIQQSRISSD
jgi:hypothetical protein